MVFASMHGPAAHDLAFEERQVELAAGGQPSLFLYRWPQPGLVLGYGQPARSVDLDEAAAREIPVLRRRTGGMGVVHQEDQAISLALPAGHDWAGDVRQLYDHFLRTIEAAVTELGAALTRETPGAPGSGGRSPICFEDRHGDSLLKDGRKAVGCSQLRRDGAHLIHGHLTLGLDADLQAALFGVTPARVEAAVAPIGLPPSARERLPAALWRAFGRALAETPFVSARPRLDAATFARLEGRQRAPFTVQEASRALRAHSHRS
jgi:lipoate-protein ligase A